MRTETDRILLDAAAAGASLDDLATLAACAIEKWRQQQPDPDDPDDGFDDRYVQAGTTFGGAGVIRGNLTPECTAAVRAVLEALGKKAGPEDDRTEGKRFHDALQLACELLLRAKLVPDRAGADTQVIAHIPLSQLRQLPGAGDLEDAWIRAFLGEDGYLAGKDAEAAACDAPAVPVVTGTTNPAVIDQMIDLARTAAQAQAPAGTPDPAGRRPATPGRASADPLPGPVPRSVARAALRDGPPGRRPGLRPRRRRRDPPPGPAATSRTTPRACRSTSATATASPGTSAAPSCCGTANAPGPAAAAPPSTATSTTCATSKTAARPPSTTSSCSASTTTTSASTATAGNSPSTPTAPPKPAAPTANRPSTATRHPPRTPPEAEAVTEWGSAAHRSRLAASERWTTAERILSALRTSRVSVVATVVGVTSVPATPPLMVM